MESPLDRLRPFRPFIEEMKNEGYPDSSHGLGVLIGKVKRIHKNISRREEEVRRLVEEVTELWTEFMINYGKIFDSIEKFQNDRAGKIIMDIELAGLDVCTVCGQLDLQSNLSLYLGEDLPFDGDEPARYSIVRRCKNCIPCLAFLCVYEKVSRVGDSFVFSDTDKPVTVTFEDERYEFFEKAENRKLVLDQLAQTLAVHKP